MRTLVGKMMIVGLMAGFGLLLVGCNNKTDDVPPATTPDDSGEQAADDGGADPEVESSLAELSEEDRALATQQEICPVSDKPLGSMGAPPKVDVDGKTVFICCEGCRENLLANKEEMLEKVN